MTATGVDAIPLAEPVLGVEEEERVLAVLRSGRLSLGPVTAEFEAAFAARVGAIELGTLTPGTTRG